MADQDKDSKTEDATPKKLSEARNKGNVPVSKEVNNWIMLFVATAVIMMMGGWLMKNIAETVRFYLASAHMVPDDMGAIGNTLAQTFIDVAKIIAVPIFCFMIAGLFGSYIQNGFIFSTEQMKIDFSKLSPMKGLKRLFGLKGVIEALKGIGKLAIIGSTAAIILLPIVEDGPSFVGMDLIAMLKQLQENIFTLMIYVLAILIVIMIADVVYQRWQWHENLKMTKQEVKDEFKQSEGDPKVKQRLRKLRMEKAMQRMFQRIPEADVVITNPTHYAIALAYNMDTMNAPVCIAKGQDLIALRIREAAEEHSIPIVENPPLARALHATVELEEEVPEEHYKAVAEVISYIFNLKKGKL